MWPHPAVLTAGGFDGPCSGSVLSNACSFSVYRSLETHTHQSPLCSALLVIMPRSLSKCRILCTSSFASSQAQAAAVGIFSPLVPGCLGGDHAALSAVWAQHNPLLRALCTKSIFGLLVSVILSSKQFLKVQTVSVSSWLNYLQSSSAIKYRSL